MNWTCSNSRFRWRQLAGCIVIYAFFLHSVLAGVVGASLAARATQGNSAIDVICSQFAGESGAPGGLDPDRFVACDHCEFCTVAANVLIAPPAGLGAIAWVAPSRDLRWLVRHCPDMALCEFGAELPRGPPLMA